MASGTHTYWGMTLNNYDDRDIALITQGYPEHIRQLVWTYEKAPTTGTLHIQAYIRMKRDCRLSMMKKLFPGASFKYVDSAEYQLNAQRYAQKLDETAVSAATITNWDPVHTLEGVIKKMVIKMLDNDIENLDMEYLELEACKTIIEKEMVKEDYRYAKIFVSSTYSQMWRKFGHEMYENIAHTHTHTHTDEKLSRRRGITNGENSESGSEGQDSASLHEDSEDFTEDESDEDSETSETEGPDEGSDDECSESDSQSQE